MYVSCEGRFERRKEGTNLTSNSDRERPEKQEINRDRQKCFQHRTHRPSCRAAISSSLLKFSTGSLGGHGGTQRVTGDNGFTCTCRCALLRFSAKRSQPNAREFYPEYCPTCEWIQEAASSLVRLCKPHGLHEVVPAWPCIRGDGPCPSG